MADKTWPTAVTKGFAPEAHEEGVKHDVEITTARNGRVTTRSLPGARWSATLKFPTLTMVHLQERRALEAFLTSLRGGADRLNLWNLLTPQPLGAFWGTPVLAVDAAAGARSVQISGALPRPNMRPYGGFDIEPGGGIATGWQTYDAGAPSGAARDTDLLSGTDRIQRLFTTTLGPTSGDRAGFQWSGFASVVAGNTYTFSVDAYTGLAGYQVELAINWALDGTYLSESSAVFAADNGAGGYRRLSVTGVAPPTANRGVLYVWIRSNTGAVAANLFLNNAQFNLGTSTAYAGPAKLLRGDRIAIGGRRVMVTADATANDAGALTVEFEGPLPAAVSAGAPVVFDKPTTKFILAAPLPDFPARADELPGFSIKLVEDPF